MTVNTLSPPPSKGKYTENQAFTPGYLSFYQSIHEHLGGSSGTIRFRGDTVKTKLDGRNIGIVTNNKIYLNNIEFPTSASSVGYILAALSSTSVGLVNPLLYNFGGNPGSIRFTFKTTPVPGWIMLQEGTVGNLLSGATLLADSAAANLFSALWNNISNTYAPVSGGRGASAASDFSLGKTIALPALYGRIIVGAGSGSGLATYNPGQTGGAETVTLTEAQMGAHTHQISYYTGADSNLGAGYPGAQGGRALISNASTTMLGDSTSDGGNIIDWYTGTEHKNSTPSAHNNVQPTIFLNAMIKI